MSGHRPGCIRGTGVYLETDPELTCVCTCYGETDIATADNPTNSEAIASRHHDALRYVLADQAQLNRVQSAPFINHDDQELLLIETLAGRSTPYVAPKGVKRSPSSYL